MIALVKHIELERIGRPRRPQAEGVDMGTAPAGNRRVISNGLDRFARMPNMPDRSVFPMFGLDAAAKADLIFEFRPWKFPRIAK